MYVNNIEFNETNFVKYVHSNKRDLIRKLERILDKNIKELKPKKFEHDRRYFKYLNAVFVYNTLNKTWVTAHIYIEDEFDGLLVMDSSRIPELERQLKHFIKLGQYNNVDYVAKQLNKYYNA